jgi:outer membrane assembly lipoprotein YfiO
MPLRFSVILLCLCAFWWSACGPKYIAPEPSVEDLLSEAKVLYEKGEYANAKEKFEAIRFDYPGHPLIGEVQFYVGLCFFQLHENINAQQEFESFLREFPSDNPFADDAMFYLCKCLFEQSLPARLDQALTKKTIEEADAFLEAYPKSAFADEARSIKGLCTDRMAEKDFLAGRIYRRMGYTSSAILCFRNLEKEYPETRWPARGRYEWALCLYKQKSYAEARAMADTSGISIKELEKKNQDQFNRTEGHGFAYRFFHLFGFFPYEMRSEIKIYLDDLKDDLSRLSGKIDKKLQKAPPAKP